MTTMGLVVEALLMTMDVVRAAMIMLLVRHMRWCMGMVPAVTVVMELSVAGLSMADHAMGVLMTSTGVIMTLMRVMAFVRMIMAFVRVIMAFVRVIMTPMGMPMAMMRMAKSEHSD